MKVETFSCDGAPLPPEWKDDGCRTTELVTQGAQPNLNLRLESLTEPNLSRLTDLGLDLVRIAACCFAADQSVSRGGASDPFLADWRRRMRLVVPVSSPELWSDDAVDGALRAAVNYVSDDFWEFQFTQLRRPHSTQTSLFASEAPGPLDPSSVVLLSGGMDSLAAVLSLVREEGARPLLISHRPAPVVASHQTRVADGLRDMFPTWSFPHLSPWINRSAGDPPEVTQRTRSFLFACLGAAVAAARGLTDVVLSDNGVVSLNIPINQQLVGARASRSTHPKFLWLFNRLCAAVWPKAMPSVRNTLLLKTREETARMIVDLGRPGLIRETVSCSSPYRRAATRQHCGVCSQCVGRRFATKASGLEEYDPTDGYEVDIFQESLPEGSELTMAASFVRFAREVLEADGQDYWMRHGEFADCILPDDPQTARTAGQLVSVLRRHAGGVIRVMEGEVERHRRDIATGQLPPRSLLALVGSRDDPSPRRSEEFVHFDGYRTVIFRGDRSELTESQAALVGELHRRRKLRQPEVDTKTLRHALNLSEDARFDEMFKRSNQHLYCKGDSLIVHGQRRGTLRLNLSSQQGPHEDPH